MNGGFIASLNQDGSFKHDPQPLRPNQDQDQDQDQQQQLQLGEDGANSDNRNEIESGAGGEISNLDRGTRRLTSKQEARLRAYLEDKLLELSRGWKKRYTSNSTLSTLSSFLSAHISLLSILSSIPPLSSSSTSLLTSYLLRVTSDLSEGISGYSISQSQSTQLSQTIIILDLLDKIWSALLNGRMLNFKVAESSCHKNEEKRSGNKLISLGNNSDSRSNDDHTSDSESASNGRYGFRSGSLDPFSRSMSSTPAPFSSQGQVESFSILGSKGISTLGQTDKVRLRNLLVGSKENLFLWMRKVLDAPAPPKLMGASAQEEAEALFGWRNEGRNDTKDEKSISGMEMDTELPEKVSRDEQEDQNRLEKEEEELGMEDEMEEVLIGNDNKQPLETDQTDPGNETNRRWDDAETDDQREEHEHYRRLFDRKLDPDASDSEDDERNNVDPLGLQIKSSSTSAQPISFVNSRSIDRLGSLSSHSSISNSEAISNSKADRDSNLKKRKLSSFTDKSNSEQSLPKLGKSSKSDNQSILSRLNQAPKEKQKREEEKGQGLDVENEDYELPYEGAPSRGFMKPEKKSKGTKEKDFELDDDQPDSKEKGSIEDDDSDEHFDGMGSEASFSGSVSSSNNVLLWDLIFSRLFSRTLKGLAEK